MTDSAHSAHEDHTAHRWLLGISGGIGVLSLAPYVLPAFGIGGTDDAHNMMSFIGAASDQQPFGSGIAGKLQGAFASIPIVGEALTSTTPVSFLGLTMASGALTSIAATSIIGIGGALFANWLAKREDPHAAIHWSKIIRIAAIATSMLIALPSVISAVSVAITFLASVIGPFGSGSYMAKAMTETLGATTAHAGAASGISTVLSHLISCGIAILPVGLATFLGGSRKAAHTNDHYAMASLPFELVSACSTVKDQPCQMSFRLSDPATGQSLTPQTLDTTFTKKFHLMLVDQTLSEYHHLHPTFDASTGQFSCEFTPRSAQPFKAWCDFTPKASGKAVRELVNLPTTRSVILPARINTASDVSLAGITAHIASDSPLTMGKDSILRVELRDSTGQPISNLGPVMGAYAHLAGFSVDKQHFIHTHPITPLGAPIRNGTLEFHVAPEHAGLSKFFLQINHDGQEVIIPFGRAIAPNLSYRERVSSPAPSQHQHAMA